MSVKDFSVRGFGWVVGRLGLSKLKSAQGVIQEPAGAMGSGFVATGWLFQW